MKRLITLSHLLLAAVLAQAQYSVKKIDINKTGPATGSRPQGIVAYKGLAFFTADDGIHGRELWWSDGEDAGMVADINSGNGDGLSAYSNMCVVKDVLYFSAFDGNAGVHLWAFDAMSPPAPAAAVSPSVSNHLYGLTELNDELYFRTYVNGGTQQFKFDPDSAWFFKTDSLPGTKGWYDFYQMPVAFKGRILYQVLIDPAVGRELYEYVPGQGMSLVTDIYPGSGSSEPEGMYVLGDKLYFQAVDPQHGNELYMWDGVNPVQRVTDLEKGPSHSFRYQQSGSNDATPMIGYHGKLYFSALSQKSVPYPQNPVYDLYRYDPANGNLKVVMPQIFARNMVVYAGNLFFTGYLKDSLFTATEFMYNDVLGGGDFGSQFTPRLLMYEPAVVNNKLFFNYGELHVLTDARALHVPEATKSDEVKIYPNPASSEAHISLTLNQSSKLSIQLTDIQGRNVYAAKAKQYPAGKHEIKMPVQGLAAGNYIYSVMSDSGEILGRGKLVKE